MLQNARITAFTISDLLRVNQQWRRRVKSPPPRLGLKLPNFKQFQNMMRSGFMIDSQLSFNILPETTS